MSNDVCSPRTTIRTPRQSPVEEKRAEGRRTRRRTSRQKTRRRFRCRISRLKAAQVKETWRLHSLIAPLALRVIFISVYFISLQSIWVKNKRKRWAKPPGIVLFSQVQFNMNGASTSSLGARCRTNSNTESCILGKIIPMRWLLTLVPLLPLPPGPPGPAGSGGGSGRALL